MNGGQKARVLQEVLELCESGEFEADIFLQFISSGLTKGLTEFSRLPFAERQKQITKGEAP